MIKKLNSKNLFVPLILSCISVFSNTYTFAEQVNADGYVTVIGGKQVQPPKLTAEELKKPYSKYFLITIDRQLKNYT